MKTIYYLCDDRVIWTCNGCDELNQIVGNHIAGGSGKFTVIFWNDCVSGWEWHNVDFTVTPNRL